MWIHGVTEGLCDWRGRYRPLGSPWSAAALWYNRCSRQKSLPWYDNFVKIILRRTPTFRVGGFCDWVKSGWAQGCWAGEGCASVSAHASERHIEMLSVQALFCVISFLSAFHFAGFWLGPATTGQSDRSVKQSGFDGLSFRPIYSFKQSQFMKSFKCTKQVN